MSVNRILIVGCGKIGLRVADLLSTHHQVWGLRRSSPNNEASYGHGTTHFITADVTLPETLNNKLPQNIDYLLYCIAPTERSETAYRDVYLAGLQNIVSALSGQSHLKRIYFVSSTSVYHQDDHSSVDEYSQTLPLSFSGQVLLEAEAFCQHLSTPSTIIRFSGIYGANRSRLIDQVKMKKALLSTKPRLTNRIHEDDCVGFIQHLIQQDILGKKNEDIYLASDNMPIDLNEVIKFIATELKIELKNSLSDTAETRRAGNKKCCNKRMLASAYQFHYPSYKEGYQAMIDSQP